MSDDHGEMDCESSNTVPTYSPTYILPPPPATDPLSLPYKGDDKQLLAIQQTLNIAEGGVMRWMLGEAGTFLDLSSVRVVAMTCSWWEKDPYPLTEIGLAELGRPVTRWSQQHRVGETDDPFFEVEKFLGNSRVTATHIRIKSNAHYVNHYPGAGNAEKFNFGTSLFCDEKQAEHAVLEMFCKHEDPKDPSTPLRPVVLLGHAVGPHIAKLKKELGIDLLNIRTVIRVIDTQEMAREMDIAPPKGDSISLTHLTKYFGLVPNNLHTAGNDVVHIVVAAVLTSLTHHLYAVDDDGQPVITNAARMNKLVNHMMQLGKMALPPWDMKKWGITIFCTRCDRTNHYRAECRDKWIECENCKGSGNAKNVRGAKTHRTEKCLFRPVVKPAAETMGGYTSGGPTNSYGHTAQDNNGFGGNAGYAGGSGAFPPYYPPYQPSGNGGYGTGYGGGFPPRT